MAILVEPSLSALDLTDIAQGDLVDADAALDGANTGDLMHLALLASQFGNVPLMHWLLTAQHVPKGVRNSNGNLLHAAVIGNSYGSIRYLLHDSESRDLFDLFFEPSPSTALQMAVERNHIELVTFLEDFLGVLRWIDRPAALDIVSASIGSSADESVRSSLKAIARRCQIVQLALVYNPTVERLQEIVSSFDWWSDRDYDWSIDQRRHLYVAIDISARSGNADVVKWFLDECRVSLVPPEGLNWSGMSVADNVALAGVCFSLDDLQRYDNTDGTTSARWLYNLVVSNWDGKDLDQLMGRFEKYLERNESNVWYKALSSQGSDAYIDVIRVLATRVGSDGTFCLPRLDVVIAAGHLKMLQWLVDSAILDLSAVGAAGTDHTGAGVHGTVAVHDGDIDYDNMCPICYTSDCHRTALSCGHRFCEPCLLQWFSQRDELVTALSCPTCRSGVPVSARFLATSHLYSILGELDWLKCSASMTVAEILVGIAAGFGSAFILQWLVETANIDVERLSFQGRTLLHIASDRGQTIICLWILHRHPALAGVVDSNGASPADTALSSSFVSESYHVLASFVNCGHVPRDWPNVAVDHPCESIRRWARDVKATLGLKRAVVLLNNCPDAPITSLANLFEPFDDDLRSPTDNGNIIPLLFALAACNRRYDVLRWLFSAKFDKWRLEILSWNGLGAMDIFQVCELAATDGNDSHDHLQPFLEEIRNIRNAVKSIRCFEYQTLPAMIDHNAPISEFEAAIEARDERYRNIPDDFREFLPAKVRLTEIVIGHGLNALQYAFEKGSLAIMEACLNRVRDDLSSTESLFSAVLLRNGNVQNVSFLLEWLERKGLPVDGPVVSDDSTYGSLLAYFAKQHALYLSLGRSLDTKGDCARYWDVVQYLLQRDGVAKNPPQILFNYGESRFMTISSSDDEIEKHFYDVSAQILRAFRALIAAGANLSDRNDDGKLIVESMLSSPTWPVYLQTIAFLVRDHGIDIQFLAPTNWVRAFGFNFIDFDDQFASLQREQAGSRIRQ
ncbi:hypothetical protein PBRA_002015 [Plasmodiophora brassicae]|uniref:RING-type domain-containing protein n=1 Tax=Plasmodiophora brassicae TaxID=37360 RepID=A0A0G4J225_PLABS|nr:hypothetical protein PBRA_002015 [Plasmodiophora brassicae]